MRTYCRILFSIVALFLILPAFGFTPPPTKDTYLQANDIVFRQDEVARIDLTISQEALNTLFGNVTSDVYQTCTMRWRNSQIDETHENVGVRFRGGVFTRPATRKSWSLDINEFVVGRRFYGLKKMDLNGEHNDPTILRRMMAHRILGQMGLATARTHFVALYINGSFWSITVHTEHMDDEFTSAWFGNKAGNLYASKTDFNKRPAEDYQNEPGWDEKNNAPLTDYTDLRDLIRMLHDATNAERLENLEYHLNIDDFLRYQATNIALGSWDDYWYNANNYYIYHNTRTQRFEWIPYDYDNSIGMDYFNINWADRNFENWGAQRPLTDALFDHSPWRGQFRRHLASAAALLINTENQNKLDEWHALLLPYFDGTIESGGIVGTQSTSGQHNPYFYTGRTQPTTHSGGSFHSRGIKPFMTRRRNTLVAQLGGFPSTALPRVFINEVIASNTSINTDEADEYEDWIELYNDENTAVDVSGWHLSDDVTSSTMWMIPQSTVIPAKGFLVIWCDNQPEQGALHATFSLAREGEYIGLFHDTANGRVPIDRLQYPLLGHNRSFGRYPDGTANLMEFQVVTPSAANDNSTPGGGTEPRTPPRLYVNEIMAQNNSTIGDEEGNWADWFELYSDEQVELDLGGMYLTDNLGNPTKWRIPDGISIAPNGYLLFWADGNTAQGNMHTNFSLSAGGESVGIYDNDDNQNQEIDVVTFGPQSPDISIGRLPNGTGGVVVLEEATPGFSNEPVSGTDTWMVY